MTDPAEGETPTPVIGRGDVLDGQCGISRQYPWNDQPVYRTCYLIDATWELGDLKGQIDVDDLPVDRAEFASNGAGEVLDHLDLYADFQRLFLDGQHPDWAGVTPCPRNWSAARTPRRTRARS